MHDFWYEESQREFERVLKADAGCAIAHWGVAMSLYHQIWNRPGEAVMTRGWSELQKATGAKTEREKGDSAKALGLMRETADLQDKVGQGEVDIPVREMLADMLLDLRRPKDALVEYEHGLQF